VPEDMEEESSLTTKDVLSFAWRGLKESRYVKVTQYALNATLTSTVCCYALSRDQNV
jgi:hypothetical protein